ncbi:hypothetical protein SNEBB_009483 [Seison nebaliae]|nr:hypothetical protein SNEBB_009483 [Seison nebaliae]
MKDQQDEEYEEPSVNSKNREERILARRIRIENRKNEKEEKPKEVVVEEKNREDCEFIIDDEQVINSRERLIKLYVDGCELVSNIRTAELLRESNRRKAEAEANRVRKERLEQETRSATEKFDEIIKQWESAAQKNVAQELYEILMEQRKFCDLMIDEKNKLISDFEDELKKNNEEYTKMLKRCTFDSNLLVERMKNQIETTSKAHKEETSNIENYLERNFHTTNDKNRTIFEKKIEFRDKKEMENLDEKLEKIEKNGEEIDEIYERDAEDYNNFKIQLENNVQSLELQLEQMKATFQLNQEKLDYNYQVLKKREEENIITKAKQKRKINKLTDVSNNLKGKLNKQKETFEQEIQKLSEEYQRLATLFQDLQDKSQKFMKKNKTKLESIWNMKVEECQSVIDQIKSCEKVIHEQQLGLDIADVKDERVCQPVKKNVDRKSDGKTTVHETDAETPLELSNETQKKIFQLICNEAGFLIDEKVLELLDPLPANEQSLIRLDAICQVFGLHSQEEIEELTNYFISKKSDEPSPNDIIHPNDVLAALKDFTSAKVERENQLTLPKSKVTTKYTHQRRRSYDKEFWKNLTDSIVTTEKKHLWETLKSYLKKYNENLSERQKLLAGNDELRQQNIELKMLLAKYINTKINDDLVLPPAPQMMALANENSGRKYRSQTKELHLPPIKK